MAVERNFLFLSLLENAEGTFQSKSDVGCLMSVAFTNVQAPWEESSRGRLRLTTSSQKHR